MMRIGQAAQYVGVHPDTIRAWADIGKLKCERSPSGHRQFSTEALDLVRKSAPVEQRSQPAGAPTAYSALVGPQLGAVVISDQSALSITAVWSAITTISGTVATLPLVLFRRLPDGGKERASDHPLWPLLSQEPNPNMTGVVFRELLQSSLLRYGNGFAYIERAGNGTPLALWPLHPEQVWPDYLDDGSVIYRTPTGNLRPHEVLHIPGLSWDGLRGYSPIRVARQTLSIVASMDQFSAAFFQNNARPSGWLKFSGVMDEQSRENLKRSFRMRHQGSENAGSVPLLEAGVEFVQASIPQDDAQWIESRRLMTEEIARIFNISPLLLHDLTQGHYNNLEQENTLYIQQTLLPWLKKTEAEMNRKLLLSSERDELFVEHVVDGLLRADTPTRYAAYSSALTAGWLSINEVRAAENRNAIAIGTDSGTANLRTTVGGSTQITAVQEAYFANLISEEAAVANLVLVFGFTQSQASELLSGEVTAPEPQPAPLDTGNGIPVSNSGASPDGTGGGAAA